MENLANAAERRLSEEGDPGPSLELLFELRQVLDDTLPAAQRAQQQERPMRGPQAAQPNNAQPPENFRELSIVPAPEDFDPNTDPFLRLNRVCLPLGLKSHSFLGIESRQLEPLLPSLLF